MGKISQSKATLPEGINNHMQTTKLDLKCTSIGQLHTKPFHVSFVYALAFIKTFKTHPFSTSTLGSTAVAAEIFWADLAASNRK